MKGLSRLLDGSGKRFGMSQLFRFPTAVRRDPAIDVWMQEYAGELGAIAFPAGSRWIPGINPGMTEVGIK